MPDFLDTSDRLAQSSILRGVSSHRVAFDPAKKSHCASLKSFLETGKWGDVMFYPEYPYTDVPTYVLAKFACHALKVQRKTSAAQLQFAESRARAIAAEDKADTHELVAATQE